MLNKQTQSKKKAFTLIELLVVIAIIGILATIAVVALQQARQSARDSKRIADVKQMQTALELYYNYNSEYPDDITSQIADASTTYMEIVPNAPTPADGDCDSTSNQYVYAATGTENSSYTLSFCLGSQTGGLALGSKCATPGGILDEECGGGSGGGTTWACGDLLAYEGYDYETVEIGTQCWFAENLQTDTYNNGSPIPNITDNTEWENDTSGAYCCYDNDSGNCDTYGALYNWYAVNTGNLCPAGWHVPNDEEFKILEGTVDSTYPVDDPEWDGIGEDRGDDAGSKLAGNETLWEDGVLDEHTNFGNSGFNVLPAGERYGYGGFSPLGSGANFWSSQDNGPVSAWRRYLFSVYSSVGRSSLDQAVGYSIRCLKD
jgi:uncharacterized protein (TIGR02145 family)/prepilin-type N-terminal cleavage/methylation domain-containing protein